MTNPTLSQMRNATADSLTWSSSLVSLADTSYVLSSTVIDNRETAGTTVSYDLADLQIVFGTAYTPVSGGYIAISMIDTIDGTNYPSPPTSSTAGPVYMEQTFPLKAVSTTVLLFRDLIIRPYQFKILIGQRSGAAFPAGTITATLQRRSVAFYSV